MMTKKEYRQAVRQAVRVFVYIQITDLRKQPVRLSKVRALQLVRLVPNGAQINAEWASDERLFLLVG